TPLIFIAIILITTVGAALLAGRQLRRKAPQQHHQDSESLLTSAVLGLLALLLSFTFALATERYEARPLLVQQEANAVGAMHLRVQLLQEPHRSRISRILIAYADNRIALAHAAPKRNGDLLAKNDRLIHEFWLASAAAFPSIQNLDFSSTFYDSVNHLIDLDA